MIKLQKIKSKQKIFEEVRCRQSNPVPIGKKGKSHVRLLFRDHASKSEVKYLVLKKITIVKARKMKEKLRLSQTKIEGFVFNRRTLREM